VASHSPRSRDQGDENRRIYDETLSGSVT